MGPFETVPQISDASFAPLRDQFHQVVFEGEQRCRQGQYGECSYVKTFPLSNGAVWKSGRWQWRRRSASCFSVACTGGMFRASCRYITTNMQDLIIFQSYTAFCLVVHNQANTIIFMHQGAETKTEARPYLGPYTSRYLNGCLLLANITNKKSIDRPKKLTRVNEEVRIVCFILRCGILKNEK